MEIEQHRVALAADELAALVDSAEDAIIGGRFGAISSWNRGAERLFGYTAIEAIGRSPAMLVPPERRSDIETVLARLRAGGRVSGFPSQLLSKDGRILDVAVSAALIRDPTGEVIGESVILRDVTAQNAAAERLRASEERLQRTSRALKTLSSGNKALVNAHDAQALLDEMCRIMVDVGGYRMAWIGRAEMDSPRRITPLATSGATGEFFERVDLTWDARSPRGGSAAALAIRTGAAQVVRHCGATPETEIWRAAVTAYGIASAAAFPLYLEDGSAGVLSIYAAEPDAFDGGELALLEELANDTTFGLWTQHQRFQREQSLERLRRSMEQTVQALASTVEMRDPYTAGHQQRVAALAVEIARVLHVPDADRRGIYLAGIVHDIGKIRVPAEILGKPGLLSAAERRLTQAHARAGYEILRTIDLPWPVADIVYQHHERLDGSGYPRGLSAGEIGLGARIVAVADVVEAMTSHRPYRPVSRVADALREIGAGSETLFDAAAVEACTRLFTELRFAFPEPASPVEDGRAAS